MQCIMGGRYVAVVPRMLLRVAVAACAILPAACSDVFFARPAEVGAQLTISSSAASPNGTVFDKANRLALVVTDRREDWEHETGQFRIFEKTVSFSPAAETRVSVPITLPEGTTVVDVAILLMRDDDALFLAIEEDVVIQERRQNAVLFDVLFPFVAAIDAPPSVRNLNFIGDTTTIVVTPRFATGDIVQDAPCLFTSDNTAVASVEPTTGRVEARGSGKAQIGFDCWVMSLDPLVFTVTVTTLGPALAPVYSGTYSWICGATGTTPLVFRFDPQVPGSSTVTGTATYLNVTKNFTGRRYSQATFGQFGDISSGTPAPDGRIIEISVPTVPSSNHNIFTGTLQGNTYSGTTLNGEGCSANSGPGGSFTATAASN